MVASSRDYHALLVQGRPMMDVRAPIEYAKGAFPGTCNLPLMDDDDRQQVGLRYKQQGEQAAIALGHQLVSGERRDARIQAWADFAREHPDGYLYCFRGGLRSRIAQQWLQQDAGISMPRVEGGYKAMRGYLVQALDDALRGCSFLRLGGLTGSGKTELLTALAHGIDLEGHANHRGSSFGKRATPQPAQIDFEHAFTIDLLKKQATGLRQFVLEDESRLIGSCALPVPLFQAMPQFPFVWLEDTLLSRQQRVVQDYVVSLSAEFIERLGDEAGFDAYAARLNQGLRNILKRLGGMRHDKIKAMLDAALVEQRRTGAVDLHHAWVGALLQDYYDPIYLAQRASFEDRIEFSGNATEVTAYLMQRLATEGATASASQPVA